MPNYCVKDRQRERERERERERVTGFAPFQSPHERKKETGSGASPGLMVDATYLLLRGLVSKGTGLLTVIFMPTPQTLNSRPLHILNRLIT